MSDLLDPLVNARQVCVYIPGTPQPGGSKRAFPFRKKNGSLGVAVSDSNPKVHGWREVVAHTVADVCLTPFSGPVELRVSFFLARPKGHWGARGLKHTAPKWHTTRPDATKLLRALEDALKGIAWTDDSQVAMQSVEKLYSNDGRTGATVTIRSLVEAQ